MVVRHSDLHFAAPASNNSSHTFPRKSALQPDRLSKTGIIGRATILALHLNHERRLRIRQSEQLFGLFPPAD